jgi:2-oxoglutarate ferredoxin oxidoreductase subunit delta
MHQKTANKPGAAPAQAADQAAQKRRKGRIVILESRCKGCGMCIAFCPRAALARSRELSPRGWYPPYLASDERCTRCKTCQVVCPDYAIYITDEDEDE